MVHQGKNNIISLSFSKVSFLTPLFVSRFLFEKCETACGGLLTHMIYIDVPPKIAEERIRIRAKKIDRFKYQKGKSVAKAMCALFEHKDIKELYYIFQLLEEREVGLEAKLGRIEAIDMVKIILYDI